ncbi:hypothetical protein C8R46DRAFT_891893 [Mycena filopes]|nr:hypothetical protein C8R46DRAFT_891893 [Mycena filopes]
MPPSEEQPPSTVSRVALDVDTISSEVAAELAGALVGHVLFLKSQIPFPVMQLSRIPSGKTNPRALKLRTELLSAFDTLSSHLNTTFPALATAFALVAGAEPSPRPTRRAYLAILVGPSIGSAKTRVMLALDGVVPRVWGERNDDDDGVEEEDDSDDDESDDEDDDEEDDEDDEESGSDSSLKGSSPPPSRSPSPSPCTSPLPIPPTSRPPPPSSGPSPHQLTRLLAHTLATAPHSMAAELAPSQTHILLRAPRRFAHPAWIPRQAASPALEGVLHQFRVQAGDVPSSQTAPTKPRRTAKGLDVEGAWVTCRRGGIEFPDANELGGGAEKENETKKRVEEADEMIWWSWDGKIVGFADW